jgi:hypothetical protein
VLFACVVSVVWIPSCLVLPPPWIESSLAPLIPTHTNHDTTQVSTHSHIDTQRQACVIRMIGVGEVCKGQVAAYMRYSNLLMRYSSIRIRISMLVLIFSCLCDSVGVTRPPALPTPTHTNTSTTNISNKVREETKTDASSNKQQ